MYSKGLCAAKYCLCTDLFIDSKHLCYHFESLYIIVSYCGHLFVLSPYVSF